MARQLSDDRIALVRRNNDGHIETLEFSFRREGKVDVVADGKVQGSSWTDDALKMAQGFVMGKPMKFASRQFDSYTVV